MHQSHTLTSQIIIYLCWTVLIHFVLLLLFIRSASFGTMIKKNTGTKLCTYITEYYGFGPNMYDYYSFTVVAATLRLPAENVKFGRSSVVKWCNLNLMAIVASCGVIMHSAISILCEMFATRCWRRQNNQFGWAKCGPVNKQLYLQLACNN